jgi:hypothetical protein
MIDKAQRSKQEAEQIAEAHRRTATFQGSARDFIAEFQRVLAELSAGR